MKRLAALLFAGWMRFARLVEDVILVKLIGTLVYLFILGPTALFVRLRPSRAPWPLSPDPRHPDQGGETPGSYWRTRVSADVRLDRLEKQY